MKPLFIKTIVLSVILISWGVSSRAQDSPFTKRKPSLMVQLKTTYPSPSGQYKKLTTSILQLKPLELAGAGNCQGDPDLEGSLYFNQADKQIYICDSDQGWIVGSGLWAKNGTEYSIYPVDIQDGDNSDYKIGIGTTTPEFQLSLEGDGSLIAVGHPTKSPGNPEIPILTSGRELSTEGEGSKLIWWPRMGAFRAGYVENDQWNSSKIGRYSVAMGLDTIATGTASIAAGGFKNEALGDFSTVSGGRENKAYAPYSTIPGGRGNQTEGDDSFAAGKNMTLTDRADRTFVWGHEDNPSPATSIDTPDAFIIYSGNVGIGTTTPVEKLEVEGKIYSKEGGIKFPDETVQATALPTCNEGEIIVASDDGWECQPVHFNGGWVAVNATGEPSPTMSDSDCSEATVPPHPSEQIVAMGLVPTESPEGYPYKVGNSTGDGFFYAYSFYLDCSGGYTSPYVWVWTAAPASGSPSKLVTEAYAVAP